MPENNEQGIVTRRRFLATGVTGAAALAALGEEARAQAKNAPKAPARPAAAPAKPAVQPAKPAATAATAPPINCAVIGVGAHGRTILASLGRVPGAKVAAICDSYKNPKFVSRVQEAAPGASFMADY
ncbi:MAG TPA: hypothetical protein VFU47_17700, partial [Armatimonadota bacterium]|nr:hypothetical protein [Armatimonadota bacterium]